MNDQTHRADAPSGWRIAQALAVWQSARSRILDADLGHDEAALAELLGPEEGDVREILERILRAARHASVMNKTALDMAADINARAARYKQRADALRGTAFSLMEVLGTPKVELADLTASIRSGVPTLILSEDTVLADEYVRVTRTPDKAAIIADLKQGIVIDGAVLSNGVPSLALRTK